MAGMDGDELRAYCLSKPGAWQDEPWEGDIVAKVAVRYPDDASVMAYIGRSGWNTVKVGGAVPDDEIRELVDTSYYIVVSKLPKSRRP